MKIHLNVLDLHQPANCDRWNSNARSIIMASKRSTIQIHLFCTSFVNIWYAPCSATFLTSVPSSRAKYPRKENMTKPAKNEVRQLLMETISESLKDRCAKINSNRLRSISFSYDIAMRSTQIRQNNNYYVSCLLILIRNSIWLQANSLPAIQQIVELFLCF